MGLCRNYHPINELARDSLTCSKRTTPTSVNQPKLKTSMGRGLRLRFKMLKDEHSTVKKIRWLPPRVVRESDGMN